MISTKSAIPLAVIFIWLAHALVDIMIGIWPVYKTLANLDLALAGLIGGGCALLGEGMQILFGSLSDQGHRKTLILGGLLASTASVCFVFTDHYFVLFIFYLLTCIGSGAFHPSAASFISDLPSKRKGVLVGIYASGGALGLAVGQILYTQTYMNWKMNVLWLALPAALLTCFAAMSHIDRRSQAHRSQAHAHRFNIKTLLNFFRTKALRNLYILQVCCTTIIWVTMFLLPDFLISREYDSWIAFGGGHLMLVLGAASMMIPAGHLADRFSSRTVLLASVSIGSVLFYTLLFFPLLGNLPTLSLLFCMGAAIGVTNPLIVAFGTRLVPNQKGTISAFLMGLAWCLSEGVSQSGGGLLATLFTDDAPAKALGCFGVCFFAAFAAAHKLPREDESSAMENLVANEPIPPLI